MILFLSLATYTFRLSIADFITNIDSLKVIVDETMFVFCLCTILDST